MVPLVLNSKAHKNGIADIDQAALYGDRRPCGHSNFLDLVLVVGFLAMFPRFFFCLIFSLSLSLSLYLFIHTHTHIYIYNNSCFCTVVPYVSPLRFTCLVVVAQEIVHWVQGTFVASVGLSLVSTGYQPYRQAIAGFLCLTLSHIPPRTCEGDSPSVTFPGRERHGCPRRCRYNAAGGNGDPFWSSYNRR